MSETDWEARYEAYFGGCGTFPLKAPEREETEDNPRLGRFSGQLGLRTEGYRGTVRVCYN
jgi:hypothetical protein